jgi:DnaJ-domain-containing protein 1
MDGVTLYEVLDVAETATLAEIKAARNRLLLEVHPDKLPSASAYWKQIAAEKTREVNEAYQILSDKNKRREYDKLLAELRDSEQPFEPQPQTSTHSPQPSTPPLTCPRCGANVLFSGLCKACQQTPPHATSTPPQPIKRGLFRCAGCGAYFHVSSRCPKTGVYVAPKASSPFSSFVTGYLILIACGACFALLRLNAWIPFGCALALLGYQLCVTHKLTLRLGTITIALTLFAIADVIYPSEEQTTTAQPETHAQTTPVLDGKYSEWPCDTGETISRIDHRPCKPKPVEQLKHAATDFIPETSSKANSKPRIKWEVEKPDIFDKVAEENAIAHTEEKPLFERLPHTWQRLNGNGDSPPLSVWIAGNNLYEVSANEITLKDGVTRVDSNTSCIATHNGNEWDGTCTYSMTWSKPDNTSTSAGRTILATCKVSTDERVTDASETHIGGQSQRVDYAPLKDSKCPVPSSDYVGFEYTPISGGEGK